MKRKYYIEIENSDSILGGVYPLGEMTEKQALNECEKTVDEASERINKICSELDEIFEINGCKEVQVSE